MQALAAGAIRPDLEDFYAVARALLVKDEAHYDLYDQVFAAVFEGGEVPTAIRDELLRWLDQPRPPPHLSPEELAELEALPLEKLRELFEQRLREQRERHDGGSKWVGTGGTSPFGHGGRNPAGIRVGGQGGGRSAVQVAQQRRYREYRKDRVLDTRAMTVALRKLRRLSRNQGPDELDVDESIDRTCRNAGELELAFRPPRKNQAKVLLLMDTGGSMDPFTHMVEQLFSAASAQNHWKKFEAFFFHNCPYARIFRSYRLGEWFPTPDLWRERDKDTFLLIVGDAYMAPSELTHSWGGIDASGASAVPGVRWLHRLREHFPRAAWLNPLPEGYARGSYTIQLVRRLFPMFPLTVAGLEDAVDQLRRQREPTLPQLDLDEVTRRRKPWEFF